MNKMPTGLQLIKAERRRQVTKEKFSAKHDAERENYSLSQAAIVYERCAEFQSNCGDIPRELLAAFRLEPRDWPWEPVWFKLGRTAIRTLIKSGALYQAEVDRIERLKKRQIGAHLAAACEGCLKKSKEAVTRISQRIDAFLS